MTAMHHENPTTHFDESHFTATLARHLVEQMAPHELAMFEDVRKMFEKTPQALSAKTENGRPLGFGSGEAVAFLTPLLFAIGAYCWELTRGIISKSAITHGEKGLTKALQRLFAGERGDATVSPIFSSTELCAIREAVLTKARASVDEARAQLIADAVLGVLSQAAMSPANAANQS